MTGAADPGHGLHAIVLAAGASSRFGSPKQLVRVAGRPLLHTAVARAAEVAGAAVIVVLGARAAELAPLLKHSQSSVVVNRDWREGLASSIRTGVARLPASCTAVLLTLVDQAAVTAEDLKRLVNAWRRQPGYIAAARYGTTTGVPAIGFVYLVMVLSFCSVDRFGRDRQSPSAARSGAGARNRTRLEAGLR